LIRAQAAARLSRVDRLLTECFDTQEADGRPAVQGQVYGPGIQRVLESQARADCLEKDREFARGHRRLEAALPECPGDQLCRPAG
jgi:hypothetical protein